MGKAITIVSGKGGVGKTTISTNIAEALHAAGKKVILIDANVTSPNVTLHYGINIKGPSLHDVLNGDVSIENAIYKGHSGLMIVPGGLSFNNLNKRIRRNLSKEVAKLVSKVDYVIIDSSPGLGIDTQIAIKAADEVILVTNPELPAITDALKTKKLADENRVNVRGVIINKYSGFDFDLPQDNISAFLELPIIGIVPHDVNVMRSIKERMPVFISYPNSKSANAIKEIVNKITGEQLYKINNDKSFILWVKKMLGLV